MRTNWERVAIGLVPPSLSPIATAGRFPGGADVRRNLFGRFRVKDQKQPICAYRLGALGASAVLFRNGPAPRLILKRSSHLLLPVFPSA